MRLLTRRLRLLLATTTIVAVIGTQPAAAATPSEDVPVPGGTAAFAALVGVHTVPDRARFVSEMVRLLYGLSIRRPTDADQMGARLRTSVAPAAGDSELVPVPLSAAVWGDAVFHRRLTSSDLVVSILSDRQAAFLCYGLAALDDETLQYLADHPATVGRLYQRAAPTFAAFAGSVRIRGGRVVTPGGADGVPLWEAVVGQKVTVPDLFLAELFTQAEGRTAYLYDTLGQLDAARQRFALGTAVADPAARIAGMRALVVAWIASTTDWRIKTQPFARQPYDAAMMLMRVRADADGHLAAPSSRTFWAHAFESADLPDDPARLLRSDGDDAPATAAWLIGSTATGDPRMHAEHMDQFAFGQRVFARAAAAEMPDVLVATRGFRRYRMLMITLERIGVRKPSLYAAAARVASRISPADPARAFVATGQFQGALALLLRMRLSGSIDRDRAEALVSSLVAAPINQYGQYLGSIVRWLDTDVRAAIGPADTLEEAVIAALAGPVAPDGGPRLEWEGQRYRVDVARAERRRLEAVRSRQSGVALDLAIALSESVRTLGSSPTLESVRAVTAKVREADEELLPLSRRAALDADALSFGVRPPDPHDAVTKALDELSRVQTAADLPRTPRAIVELVDAADDVAALTLVSLAYAVDVGDPDGMALLPGDLSRRHDFGFGLRDGEQRLRAAWTPPHQNVAPGVPWHVDGSLLGLDVGLASVALRRLNTDHIVDAPTLTSNERDTFAVGMGLMNELALNDVTRDAIAEAARAGSRRIAGARTPADLDAIAAELDLDGWRQRAIRWTLAHETARLESMFSLAELVRLGDPGHEIDLDPWGTSAMISTGCVCTEMPPPGRLPLLVGRPQVGLLATAVPDLNLHVARTLSELHVPARLAKFVLSAAVQDFIDEVRATDPDDWLTLVRAAGAVPRERIEDYVAAAAAGGPLQPDSR